MTTDRSHALWTLARPTRRRATLANLVLVGILAAGTACGGDDDGTEALNVEDFVDQSNAICRAGIAEIDAMMAALGETPSQDQLAGAVDFIVDNVSAQVTSMRALGPPAVLADDMEEIWGELGEILADMGDQGPSVFEGDDPFAELRPRLADVGLTDC